MKAEKKLKWNMILRISVIFLTIYLFAMASVTYIYTELIKYYFDVPAELGSSAYAESVSAYLQVHNWHFAIQALWPFYLFAAGFMILFAILLIRSYIDLYQKQAELEQSRRTLVDSVAHELKTPLGIISTHAESMLEMINVKKHPEYLRRIIGETRRMDELVLQMLNLSKLEEMNWRVAKDPVNLKNLILEVLEYRNLQISQKQLQCSVTLEECQVKGDKFLLEQAISNLVSNAARHSPQKAEIRVRLFKNGRFDILNTGVQIPEKNLKTIWSPFVKGANRNRSGDGTGLGLTIFRQCMELLGWKYGVENTTEGVRFWFLSEP